MISWNWIAAIAIDNHLLREILIGERCGGARRRISIRTYGVIVTTGRFGAAASLRSAVTRGASRCRAMTT